jgi:hypothetical protein
MFLAFFSSNPSIIASNSFVFSDLVRDFTGRFAVFDFGDELIILLASF